MYFFAGGGGEFSTRLCSYLINCNRYFSWYMLHADFDIVVKVDTKNKGLTFKSRLNVVNFIFLRQFVHNWSALLDLVRTKHTSVFGQLYETFHSRGKGLQYCIHGHTVICIMTMMNNPSETIWEKKPPNSPSDVCWLCLFMVVRLMREQYGGGWMDTCYALLLK